MDADSQNAAQRQAAIIALAAEAGAWYTVTSNSMYPLLRKHTRVRLAPMDRPPRRGEVLALWSGTQLVVHRCVKVKPMADGGLEIHTQGDNSLAPDEPWRQDQLAGRIVEIETSRGALPIWLLDRWSRLRGALRRPYARLRAKWRSPNGE